MEQFLEQAGGNAIKYKFRRVAMKTEKGERMSVEKYWTGGRRFREFTSGGYICPRQLQSRVFAKIKHDGIRIS